METHWPNVITAALCVMLAVNNTMKYFVLSYLRALYGPKTPDEDEPRRLAERADLARVIASVAWAAFVAVLLSHH